MYVSDDMAKEWYEKLEKHFKYLGKKRKWDFIAYGALGLLTGKIIGTIIKVIF